MAMILLIENEPALQILYTVELQSMGHDVRCLSDGRTAFAQMGLLRPHLIIMDIVMPQGDGLELLNRLTAHHYNIPVIIHSSHPSYQNDLIVLAAEAFVLKSSDLTAFKTTIDKVLKEHTHDA
jgi:DNA-binding response OmpR family regulator